MVSTKLQCMEGMEQRLLLAAPGPVWPRAPFAESVQTAVVYPNQYGDVFFTDRLTAKTPFRGYEIAYDDSGPLVVRTLGAGTQSGLYIGPGRPVGVQSGGVSGKAVSTSVPKTKPNLYLGVRGTVGKQYRVKFNGPAFWVEKVLMDSKTNSGSAGSDISGVGDSDVYKFTPTKAGTWMLQVIPDKTSKRYKERLDATVVVYDKAGVPIAGSFTKAVDRVGVGATEKAILPGLRAGTTYYIRVDGKGSSVGGYGLGMWLDTPTQVQVKAVAGATEGVATPGRIQFSRSGSTILPLEVKYTVSGTARNGVDYKKLSGTVIIPAGHSETLLSISPIIDDIKEADESVTITLGSSLYYNPGVQRAGTVTIHDQRLGTTKEIS